MSQAPATAPVLYSLEEIAKTYGFSLRSLRDGARAGKFEHVRYGQTRALTPEQVAKLLAANTVRPERDEVLDSVRQRRGRAAARSA